MSCKLQGKVKTWSLSEKPEDGEKYFTCDVTYGTFRKYFHIEAYNSSDNSGEQRNSKEKHKNKLKSDIANSNYTPQCFNACITDESILNIDEKGDVTVPLYEDNKLVILDGGTRHAALESIRSSKDVNTKMIDSLPIPLIVYLDPSKRKNHFLNLNNGTKVNKSHMLSMQIATGRVQQDKFPIFDRGKTLSSLLNNDEFSPLKDLITDGQTDEVGKIQFSQLITDHKGSLIATLFGSAKILNTIERSNEWFVGKFQSLHDLFKERTDYLTNGKLLVLPPDGAKGNVANWISLVNCVNYFLYLKEQINQSGEIEDNANHIIECAKVYDNMVDGDISRKRRVVLTQAFAQRLFTPLETEDNLPCGMHFGLPIPLLVLTSESSFGVEILPSKKKGKK